MTIKGALGLAGVGGFGGGLIVGGLSLAAHGKLILKKHSDVALYNYLVRSGRLQNWPRTSGYLQREVEKTAIALLKWGPRLNKIALISGVVCLVSLLALLILAMTEPNPKKTGK